jgi:hypothetical protein
MEFAEDAATIEGTSSEPQDETAGALVGTKENSDVTAEALDCIEEDDLMWCVKKNAVMRSVYHGLPGWEYSRLAEQGRWNARRLRPWQGGAFCPPCRIFFNQQAVRAFFFFFFFLRQLNLPSSPRMVPGEVLGRRYRNPAPTMRVCPGVSELS